MPASLDGSLLAMPGFGNGYLSPIR